MRTLIQIFFILLFISCDDTLDLSDYIDINGNSSFKYNPKDSTTIIFSETGKTYLKGKMINGKRQGIWTEYVIDGNYKCYEYSFKDDIENGKCYGFTATGKIDVVGNRKDGGLDGTFVFFDLEGNPEKADYGKKVNWFIP